MKKLFCGIMISILVALLGNSVVLASEEGNVFITIDGEDYTASEYMDRVIDCTEIVTYSEELINQCLSNENYLSCVYDDMQRVGISIGKENFIYTYNDYGILISENSTVYGKTEYLYEDGRLKDFIYKGCVYRYIFDKENHILGLSDINGELVCIYEYGEYGETKAVWEIVEDNKLIHNDEKEDVFVGCANRMRYDSTYYLYMLDMFLMEPYSYYHAASNTVYCPRMELNIEKLLGEKVEYSALSMPPSGIAMLILRINEMYNSGLNNNLSAYTDSNWYTNFSGENEIYLCARIIFGENSYYFTDSSRSSMNPYLKNNREGEAWVIVNRLLEDRYRYSNNCSPQFSVFSGMPTVYSILTYDGAFTSLNGATSKGAMNSANVAYQESLYLACCIEVCNSFAEWDVCVSRPLGVSYQCYNKGNLAVSTAPNPEWILVKFPGWNDDYSGHYSYLGFQFYNDFYEGRRNIQYFNVLYAYQSEESMLNIKNLYYTD